MFSTFSLPFGFRLSSSQGASGRWGSRGEACSPDASLAQQQQEKKTRHDLPILWKRNKKKPSDDIGKFRHMIVVFIKQYINEIYFISLKIIKK